MKLMKKRLKQNAIKIVLLFSFILQGGCSAHKVACHWRGYDIVANGYENEWQGSPQYYDKRRQVSIRVTNDAEALFLCVSTSDKDLKRRLRMTGLTVWLDPHGGKEQIFGIHLPGGDTKRPDRGPGLGAGAFRPADDRGRPEENEQKPPPSETLEELEISYWGATGPLEMTIDEVRRTGIDIGMGPPKDGRMVYEFNIGFKAAPSISGLKPGMIVGLGIQAGASKPDGRKRASSGDQMGQGGPGGGMDSSGMGRGPGGSGPHDKNDLFEVWLQVQLAERTKG
jgi:hypothetical protein